jgi:hypothetical protein
MRITSKGGIMPKLGELKKVNLREIWKNEASQFTPWIAENIQELGDVLGMDIELLEEEASVGDFSSDILARDLGTKGIVIIENQLTQTDHDHLGKILTYASGFDASKVIWIAESFRDEHRQALDWLNQRTDSKTQFFGIVIEVLQIDESHPALNFKLVVLPNEWKKGRYRRSSVGLSKKSEAYLEFFQNLIDELREIHKFTGARVAQPQNWYGFASGFPGIVYGAVFAQGGRVRAEIYIGKGEQEDNKDLYDWLHDRKETLERQFGNEFEWERLDDKRASRIAYYRDGSIEDNNDTLEEIRSWCVQNLLKIKEVFNSHLGEYQSKS